jgi:hypothetical protein
MDFDGEAAGVGRAPREPGDWRHAFLLFAVARKHVHRVAQPVDQLKESLSSALDENLGEDCVPGEDESIRHRFVGAHGMSPGRMVELLNLGWGSL